MKYTSNVIDKQKRLTLIYAENREFDTFLFCLQITSECVKRSHKLKAQII